MIVNIYKNPILKTVKLSKMMSKHAFSLTKTVETNKINSDTKINEKYSRKEINKWGK